MEHAVQDECWDLEWLAARTRLVEAELFESRLEPGFQIPSFDC